MTEGGGRDLNSVFLTFEIVMKIDSIPNLIPLSTQTSKLGHFHHAKCNECSQTDPKVLNKQCTRETISNRALSNYYHNTHSLTSNSNPNSN